MYKYLQLAISHYYHAKAPCFGIGLFRFLFGLVTLQEIGFLLYFKHLIFDPIPYLDVEFPMLGFFLCLWAVVACLVCVGYRCQQAIIANYIFWLVFVNFTPLQRDFAGGFDLFMIGANFCMIFMPIDQAFAIDGLRKKLKHPFVPYSQYLKTDVSRLAYLLPVTLCLGFLYLDSALHKLFAEHWRNGLGVWLPASMPYYISALDTAWLLNNVWLQKTLGYTLLVFQFSFVFLVHNARLRPLFFIIGVGFHLGITLVLNIYPFGVGVLIFYCLVAPFSWYRKLGALVVAKTPTLTVFYDQQCPLCCRTVLVLNHFDLFKTIDFKAAQTQAKHYPALATIEPAQLLQDLYALDQNNNRYAGVDSYAKMLIAMRYPALLGYFLKLPLVYHLASHYYRKIADTRARVPCDDSCTTIQHSTDRSLYARIFAREPGPQASRYQHQISKIMVLFLLLQINSSLHYGLLYRLDLLQRSDPISNSLINASNTLILFSTGFLGITPHAFYLHDHLAGYNHLIAITYQDAQGNEKWLPWVSPEGRMLAPNWGRVHSMWANIAVTADINHQRLTKFIMKTTAFWGIKAGLDLEAAVFTIKLKKINTPSHWVKGLLAANLSASWQDIGRAKWHNEAFNLELPPNINLL